MDVSKQQASKNIARPFGTSAEKLLEQTSLHFFESLVNALPDNIVVINSEGTIQFTNKSWEQFGSNNGAEDDYSWTEYNYFSVCEAAAKSGDDFGTKAMKGIMQVVEGKREIFSLEYPCHSARKKRWFVMRIKPLRVDGTVFFLISHHDITKRKLVEEKILSLSRIDPLTKIANRRAFDEFLDFQWKHCKRLALPITLAVIDIDHFKMLNDYYGHQSGDECLKKIGAILKNVTKRPDDLCARLGGEEFAIIFGDTTAEQSLNVINNLLKEIKKLKIPNHKSPISRYVTVSVGISSIVPDKASEPKDLIYESDQQLYAAKESGRNQISIRPDLKQNH